MNSIPPMSPQELQALASEYVLGTLPSAQRQQVQRLIENDPEMARAVLAWETRLLPLANLAPAIVPPPRLWARVQKTLGWQGARPAPSRPWTSLWNSLALWRTLAGAGLAAAVFMSVLTLPGGTTTPQYVVVLVAPQDKLPGWVLQVNDRRQLNLIPLGRFEVPADKALQFWTKADSWQGPVSLGLVQPDASARIRLDQLPPLQPNQLFELTLEPATGSPIGRPTGPIQFIGRAVPVT